MTAHAESKRKAMFELGPRKRGSWIRWGPAARKRQSREIKQTRKKHGASFKAKMVPQRLRIRVTIAEAAGACLVHPDQIYEWKMLLLGGAAGVFEEGCRAIRGCRQRGSI